MNKDEILIPILTAINDLREEVRENSRKIDENSRKLDENSRKIDQNSEMIKGNSKSIISLEKRMQSIEQRMEKHEEESRKDRRAILDILYSYEQVTNNQYEESKSRIQQIEQKLQIISA